MKSLREKIRIIKTRIKLAKRLLEIYKWINHKISIYSNIMVIKSAIEDEWQRKLDQQ